MCQAQGKTTSSLIIAAKCTLIITVWYQIFGYVNEHKLAPELSKTQMNFLEYKRFLGLPVFPIPSGL